MKHHDDNLPEDPDFSFNKGEEHPFGLPSDYFSSFEEKLKNRIEVENELSDFPVLSSIQKNTVFEIPGNYFSELEKSLDYKTELAAYPTLESLAKPAFAALEEEYQKQLSESLNHKIHLLEELKPYATLYALDKVNGFTVADAYFETLAERVKERIHSRNEKSVSFLDQVWNALFGGRTAWAFGLALIIGLAFYFNGGTGILPESSDCKTLACLERGEILNNKMISNFDEEQLMELVDVSSLGKQLELDIARQDSLRANQNVILQDTNTDELLDAL
jgi:hypothetical protein